MTSKPRQILITGVSSGIGHALAGYYLSAGCRVFGISRRAPDDLLPHPSFDFAKLDLREFQQINPTIAGLLHGTDRLHLAILNAGILGKFGDLADASMDTLQETMDVNVWANKQLLDALFAARIAVDQVVAMSSGASVSGNRGWNGYSVSKAALNMLIKLYAHERPETHFSAFAPGVVDTAMQEQLSHIEADDRYPTLSVLQSKRHTPEMPTPRDAAPLLAEAMARLPERIASGEYADIRRLG